MLFCSGQAGIRHLQRAPGAERGIRRRLIQNVPDPQHHMAAKETGDAIHTVRAQHDLMREFYGEEFPVNSAHHQAAGKLGAGLIPLCVSDDGINEGFIHENGKVIGVQFHPERIGFAHRRPMQ